MVGHQNRLSRFWQELKRRRVIHVITVYASAAFVIIELIGNLTEPLNLPANLSTIVIIVLVVGFPLAIILSWIYDLTSGTFERTKPIEDIQESERVIELNVFETTAKKHYYLGEGSRKAAWQQLTSQVNRARTTSDANSNYLSDKWAQKNVDRRPKSFLKIRHQPIVPHTLEVVRLPGYRPIVE